MGLDSKQTAKLPDIVFVICIFCQLLDPLVEPFDLGCLLIIRGEIFIQGLPEKALDIELLKPVQMLDRPFRVRVEIPMAETEGIDLLLDFLQCQLMVVAHP